MWEELGQHSTRCSDRDLTLNVTAAGCEWKPHQSCQCSENRPEHEVPKLHTCTVTVPAGTSSSCDSFLKQSRIYLTYLVHVPEPAWHFIPEIRLWKRTVLYREARWRKEGCIYPCLTSILRCLFSRTECFSSKTHSYRWTGMRKNCWPKWDHHILLMNVKMLKMAHDSHHYDDSQHNIPENMKNRTIHTEH